MPRGIISALLILYKDTPMQTTLPDPRTYYLGSAVNPLHGRLLDLLAMRAGNARDQVHTLWDTDLRQALSQGENASILQTFDHVPSALAWQLLNEQLADILASCPHPDGNALVFALPLALVIGASNDLTLPAQWPNITLVHDFLQTQAIFGSSAQIHLAPGLYAAENIQNILWSDWWAWGQNPSQNCPANAHQLFIQRGSEQVSLRFIVGVAVNPALPVRDISQWGIAFSHGLGEQLAQEDLNLFVVPRSPQALPRALYQGGQVAREMGLQLFSSHVIRRFRQDIGEPAVTISVHDDQTLRIRFANPFNLGHADTYTWPLNAGDSLGLIAAQVAELLDECRLENVTVLTEQQATQVTPPISRPNVIMLKQVSPHDGAA